MTGTLDPDVTGDYLPHIVHDGKMSYRRQDGAWFIWWNTAGIIWNITDEIGVFNVPRWVRAVTGPGGTYEPVAPATGDATVTEI